METRPEVRKGAEQKMRGTGLTAGSLQDTLVNLLSNSNLLRQSMMRHDSGGQTGPAGSALGESTHSLLNLVSLRGRQPPGGSHRETSAGEEKRRPTENHCAACSQRSRAFPVTSPQRCLVPSGTSIMEMESFPVRPKCPKRSPLLEEATCLLLLPVQLAAHETRLADDGRCAARGPDCQVCQFITTTLLAGRSGNLDRVGR